MKLAFDENIPPVFVTIFEPLAKEEKLLPITEVVSARNYVNSRDGKGDVPWIRRFSADGGHVIVSGDNRMRKNVHERQALIDEGMIVFLFNPKWNEESFFVKSARLLNWWPKITQVADKANTGTIWKIPNQWQWKELEQLEVPNPEA